MTPLISIYGSFLGILDHRLTLVFMHVGFSISMAVFIYHGFIKSNIPLSLEEAAPWTAAAGHRPSSGSYSRCSNPSPPLSSSSMFWPSGTTICSLPWC